MNKKFSDAELDQLIKGERKPTGAAEIEKDRARKQGKSAAEPLHDWDAPDWSILDDRRGELPDFPLACLPAPVRAWVKRAADGAGVTVAHVAVPALGIASSLIGMGRRAQASTSWLEPMTCWTAIVGPSGSGKTPGIDVTKRGLDHVQRNSRMKIDALRRRHETKAATAKAAREQWKKGIDEAVAARKTAPQMPEAATDPGKFIAPRLHFSNTTIERVGELLQARPQGVLLLLDELAGLFANMSRYSGGADNAFWLEAWNGGSQIVERMNRSLQIENLLVGVVGGVQPDKLSRSFEGDQDGMYTRFLFAWPPEAGYEALTDKAQEFDPDIVNIIERLDHLAEIADDKLVKHTIPLSAQAWEEFEGLRQSHTEVSLKDIRRDALSERLDAEQTADLLATMERSGWVRKKENKTEGRSAWRWEVNPKLHPCAGRSERSERSGLASGSAEEGGGASCTSCTSCEPY